jgi:hypothetical protein
MKKQAEFVNTIKYGALAFLNGTGVIVSAICLYEQYNGMPIVDTLLRGIPWLCWLAYLIFSIICACFALKTLHDVWEEECSAQKILCIMSLLKRHGKKRGFTWVEEFDVAWFKELDPGCVSLEGDEEKGIKVLFKTAQSLKPEVETDPYDI